LLNSKCLVKMGKKRPRNASGGKLGKTIAKKPKKVSITSFCLEEAFETDVLYITQCMWRARRWK